MSRSEFGGSAESYFAPGQSPLATTVYTDATFTTAITDLRAVGTGDTIGAVITQVLGDGRRFFRYWGPDGFTASMYAPKGYLAPGIPDPSQGAIRIDPNPRNVFGTQVDVANEAQARISAVQGLTSGSNPDPLGYAGQISAGRRPAFYRNSSAILSENMSRYGGVVGNQTGVLSTSQMAFWAYPVVAGDVIGRVIFCSGATAAATPTNQWAALFDSTGAMQRASSDALTGAWTANTEKAFIFNTVASLVAGTPDGAAYTAATSGYVYFGLSVTAATLPTLLGATWSGVAAQLTPVLGGKFNGATNQTPPSSGSPTAPSINFGTAVNVAALPWMQVR